MSYLHTGMGPTTGERDLMNRRRREKESCLSCSEKRSDVEVEDHRTWQQWHCGCCGSWNDRTDTL